MASDAYRIPFVSHLVAMNYIAHGPLFTIIPRDVSGKPGPQYPPGEPRNLIAAIQICRAMMDNHKYRENLKTFAVRFSIGRSNAWYSQGPTSMTLDQVTNAFVDNVIAEFVVVFVDYSLLNPDNKGFHTRRRVDKRFKPAHQAISLNGKMIDQLSNAYAKLKTDDRDSQQTLQACLFKTVNTLLHEMTHVFVTYLTKGEELTPPQINDPTSAIGDVGEAGRNLEYLLFGGTINYFREPISKMGDEMCGTAYLKKASGGFYRILQKTIADTVSFNIHFPYEHEESSEQRELKSLGEGFGQDTYTDPLERSEVAYLLR